MATAAANHVTARALNRHHHMDLVLTMLVSAHQAFQASQEALDPRDKQVSRDYPAIMDLKDPWAHEETRVTKVLVEDEVYKDLRELKVPRVLRVHLERKDNKVLVEAKVAKVPRDLKETRVLLVHPGRRVMQVPVEVKVLQAYEVPQATRVHQAPWFVTGNNALLRV